MTPATCGSSLLAADTDTAYLVRDHFDRVPRDGDPRDLQAVVVDLSTGEVLAETMISAPATEAGRTVAGMAWDDERTVRVAWYRQPDGEVVRLPDVVGVSAFTVP